tara:strand:+ start:1684 stop:1899 length:216 start_codon:yes stop_codon:yes gene_type:complete
MIIQLPLGFEELELEASMIVFRIIELFCQSNNSENNIWLESVMDFSIIIVSKYSPSATRIVSLAVAKSIAD